MDRFSSREDIEFHKQSYDRGALDRNTGARAVDNPYEVSDYRWSSWNAGWADADQSELAIRKDGGG